MSFGERTLMIPSFFKSRQLAQDKAERSKYHFHGSRITVVAWV